jgi:1,4-alpha-glucan branching enzyme
MWMPECAYRPAGPWQPAAGLPISGDRAGVETFLQAAGIDWTIIDAHLVTEGAPIGNYPPWSAAGGHGLSPHQIYTLGESRVAAFPRDPTTTVQVWSGDIGYPANPWFLEFHRRHHEGGLRYWRVTDRTADIGEKAPYEPNRARAAVAEQAHHFARLVGETIANTRAVGVEDPVVLAPYDAELFGHWWREGVQWFAAARRELDAAGINVATASEALDTVGPAQAVRVPSGSWGDGGDYRVWDVPATADLWRAIYAAEAALERAEAGSQQSLARIALDQLRRTVLLIESSDWAFLISTGTAERYAAERWQGHAGDAAFLARLVELLVGGAPLDASQERRLADLVARDRVWLP